MFENEREGEREGEHLGVSFDFRSDQNSNWHWKCGWRQCNNKTSLIKYSKKQKNKKNTKLYKQFLPELHFCVLEPYKVSGVAEYIRSMNTWQEFFFLGNNLEKYFIWYYRKYR